MRLNVLSSLAVVGVLAIATGCGGTETSPAQSIADGAQRAEAPSLRTSTGTVELFRVDKGWGLIRPDDGGKDVFVQQLDIMMAGFKTLNRGDRVEYRLFLDSKGPRAYDVALLDTGS